MLGEWEQAYIHYTGAGAAILENEERENIINIINYGIFNKKIVILNCLMSVVSLFILLLFWADKRKNDYWYYLFCASINT